MPTMKGFDFSTRENTLYGEFWNDNITQFKAIAKTPSGSQIVFGAFRGYSGISWDKGNTFNGYKNIPRFIIPDFNPDHDPTVIFDVDGDVDIPSDIGTRIGLRMNKPTGSINYVHGYTEYYEIEIIHSGNEFGFGIGSFVENMKTDIHFTSYLPLPSLFDGNAFGLNTDYNTQIIRNSGDYYVNGELDEISFPPFGQTPGITVLQIYFNPESSTISLGVDNTILVSDITLDFSQVYIILDVVGNGSSGGKVKINKGFSPIYEQESPYLMASLYDFNIYSDMQQNLFNFEIHSGSFDVSDNGVVGYIDQSNSFDMYTNPLRSDDFGYKWTVTKPKTEQDYSNYIDNPSFIHYAGEGKWFMVSESGSYEIIESEPENTGLFFSDDNLQTVISNYPNGMMKMFYYDETTPYENIPDSIMEYSLYASGSVYDGNEFVFDVESYKIGMEYDEYLEWGNGNLAPDAYEHLKSKSVFGTSDNGENYYQKYITRNNTLTPYESEGYVGLQNSSSDRRIYSYSINDMLNSHHVHRSYDGQKTWKTRYFFGTSPSAMEHAEKPWVGYLALSDGKRRSENMPVINSKTEHFHGIQDNLSYYNHTTEKSPLGWWKMNNIPENGIFVNDGSSENLNLIITNNNITLSDVGPLRNGPISGISLNTKSDGSQFLYIENNESPLSLNGCTLEYWVKINSPVYANTMYQINSDNEYLEAIPIRSMVWTHIVLNFSESEGLWEIDFYKDGIWHEMIEFSGFMAGNVYFGRQMTRPSQTDGIEIAEIAIYGSLLNENEITLRYALGLDYFNIRDINE